MFKAGDLVQSKTGGPKMLILKVEGDKLWCARIDDHLKREVLVAAGNVDPYHEEGPFGVC